MYIPIFEAYVHIHITCEVSIFNPVSRRAVHRCQCCNADDANDTNNATADDNYEQDTNHDYIGSFGILPNEPKTESMKTLCMGKFVFSHDKVVTLTTMHNALHLTCDIFMVSLSAIN